MSFTVLPGFPLRSAILGYYTPKNVVVPDVKIDVTFEDSDGALKKVFSEDPLIRNELVELLVPLLRVDLAKLMAGAVATTELNMADSHNVKREAQPSGTRRVFRRSSTKSRSRSCRRSRRPRRRFSPRTWRSDPPTPSTR